MRWKKIGRVWHTHDKNDWRYNHAMVPVADRVEGDIYRIYYSGRDPQNRSIVGYFLIDLNSPHDILEVSASPVLRPGQLGCFDDNGVTPASVVSIGDRKRLYYIGWRPRSTTRMGLTPGVAESTDGGLTYTRLSRAPILHPTDKEPLQLLTAPFVLKAEAGWRMWYVSGVEWLHPDLPRYNIKSACSVDGVKWEQTGRVAIDFKNPSENALARPCVLKDGKLYRMWFSYKGGEGTYRIGYAESDDSLIWERRDHEAGIDVSRDGWDSEMVEYAFVVRHKGRLHMFYNGNGYGKSGIGLAVEA